ncbi:MAG: ATP-binding protein [Phycisphaerae bacterium]
MATTGPNTADSSDRNGIKPLPFEAVRWHCDPSALPFGSTKEVEPMVGVVGQDDAIEALRFGLETNAPGQNVFVRGLTGTGRMTILKRMLEDIQPTCPLALDRCYVHNFGQPDRPRLITLPRGKGEEFRGRIDKLIKFIRDDLAAALASESIKARQSALERTTQNEFEQATKPFEEALRSSGLGVVTLQAGPVAEPAILPLVDGKPIPLEEFDQLHTQGKITDEHHQAVHEGYENFKEQLPEIGEKVNEIRQNYQEAVRELLEKSARSILIQSVRRIEKDFDEPGARTFVSELIEDLVANHLAMLDKADEFTRLYRVNVVLKQGEDAACPIIVENTPTIRDLLGTIDYEYVRDEEARSTHMGIRAGSLLRADGGYLILEASDLLSEPGAWKVLVRTLRTGRLEITPQERMLFWSSPALKPEPIDVHVKVILLGASDLYYLLDAYDPDFSQLFKVLADFDTTIPRDDRSIHEYARVLARIADEEELNPFDRSAVAMLVEHGARIAAQAGKLTARFGRLADIAREASFVAGKANRTRVNDDDVRQAVRRSKRRADLPARRFREFVANGTIRVQTEGEAVGQINGLAVMHAGPLMYGFPARITATIGPGRAGVLNIEREAALSGAIHTKGFYILGGLLRWLLRTDHPLAFDASIAFEQSYGGIDGDSASGAEICCLLSALTNVPLRQDLAMTGAIDQVGNILPVGSVNEKIEGFFDACRDINLTGTQGVIIPQANAGDLMIREDVVDACRDGTFRIYAVQTIHEALEVLTGTPAGRRAPDGRYPEKTLLALAVDKARDYWTKAAERAHHGEPTEVGQENAEATPQDGGMASPYTRNRQIRG